VHGCLDGWFEGSFERLAVEGDDHNILWLRIRIVETARSDEDVTLGGTRAHVAFRPGDEA